MDIAVKRFVEWRLKRYKVDKSNLEYMTSKQMIDRYYLETERSVNCIESVLSKLQPEDMKLINLLYIDNTHPMMNAAEECNMRFRIACRHSSAVLTRIAQELGIERE